MSASVGRVLLCVAFLAGSVLDAAGQAPRCGPPASAVSKSGAVTQLRFGNGKRVTLTDEPDGGGQVTYEYRGYDEASGLHWVRLILWGRAQLLGRGLQRLPRGQVGAGRHPGGVAGRIPSRDDWARCASPPARESDPCAVTRAFR